MYIASLVLGLLSLMLCWVPFFNVILALVALTISIVAVTKKREDKTGRGMSISGFLTSSISILISIIFCIVIIKFTLSLPGFVQNIVTEFREELDIENISGYVEAEKLIQSKYVQVNIKNKEKKYTGYINSTTEEYTDRLTGIEIDDFYENYLKESGYDYDIFVSNNGKPSIDE